MTLEQVNALVTTLELSNVIKDGMCISEPIPSRINQSWIDVFFTYGINYEEKNYSGPITVFGVDSVNNKISFIKKSSEYDFFLTANDVVTPTDWEEENSIFYEDYSLAYETTRDALNCGEINANLKCKINRYIELLRKYVDASFWNVYDVLLKDLKEYCEEV